MQTVRLKETMESPSQHEKLIAAGLNFAAIPFPYMGPIIGYVVGSKSSFVRFHALRSLIEQLVLSLLIGFLMACSLGWTIYTLLRDGFDLQKIDWTQQILKAVFFWLLFGLFGLLNTLNSILDGVQALQGRIPTSKKWSERLAMKWSRYGVPALDSRPDSPSA
jgi:uncharacterized membrane protein